MVYFRFFYEDQDPERPVIEVPFGEVRPEDITRILKELEKVIFPDLLTRCQIRFMKK